MNHIKFSFHKWLLLVGCLFFAVGFFDIEDEPLDESWKDGETFSLPSAPDFDDLQDVDIGGATSNLFFVERGTLRVDLKAGVIRYVLVARSPSGAQSVTFEGIYCNAMERRLYASWHERDRQWVPMKNSSWRKLSGSSLNNPRTGLAMDYLCDGPAPARNEKEALRALEGKRTFIDPRRH